MATGRFQRNYGQGGGYGQAGPGLNFGDEPTPGFDSTPYRVAPSRAGGGYHAGPYEAEHYRQPSEREPGAQPDQRGHRWNDRPLDTGHRGKGPRNYQRADHRLEEDVNERLTQDSWLDATDIRVAVDGGVVTLDGTVDGRDAKHRAEHVVESLPGVREVRNNLRVQAGDVGYSPPSALEAGAGPSGGSGAGQSGAADRTGAVPEGSREGAPNRG